MVQFYAVANTDVELTVLQSIYNQYITININKYKSEY